MLRKSLFFIGLVLIVVFLSQGSDFKKIFDPFSADASSHTNISGYAWSSNIGWISFSGASGNGSSYGVTMITGQNNTATFSSDSYAWSSNIGWIKFDSNISGPFPTVGADHGPRVETDGRVTGWARACSVFQSGCSGTLRSDAERGGWDGWIRFDSTGSSSDVHFNQNSKQFSGYAWGSEVVGWISFCDPNAGANYCVRLNSLNPTCSANPNPANITTSPGSVEVTWTADSPIGSGYNYNWSFTGGSGSETSGTTVRRTYNSAGSFSTTLTVTDSSGGFGQRTCSPVVVNNPNERTLYVNIDGSKIPASASVTDGSGFTCNSNSGGGGVTCSQVYSSSMSIVNLSRSPSGNISGTTFNWSSSNGSCVGNGNSCTVNMDQDTIVVYASFNDSNQNPNLSWGVLPNVIRINYQNAGVPALTTKSVLNATNNGTGDAKICLDSVISKVSGKSLDEVISSIPIGNYPAPECFLGNTSGNCNQLNSNCVDVPAGQSIAPTDVYIKIPDKLYEVLVNSPYEVKLQGKNGGVPFGSPQVIEFRYQVPDIRPR